WITLMKSNTTRRSAPMTRSRLRNPTSKSTTATVLPDWASAAPRAAVDVVLPTPPLPDVTTRTFAIVLFPKKRLQLRGVINISELRWPYGAEMPGYRERPHHGPAQQLCTHIPKWALSVVLRGGGPSAAAVVVRIGAAAQDARSVRRCDGRHCAACPRVPSTHFPQAVSGAPHRCYRCRSPPPRRGRYHPGFRRRWRRR